MERPGADEVERTRGQRGLAGIIATPAGVNGVDKTYHWGGGMGPNALPPLTVSSQLRRLSSYRPSPYDLRATLFPIECYCKLAARDTVARNFRPLANPFHQEPSSVVRPASRLP